MIYLLNKSQVAIKAYSVNNAIEAKVTQGINEANQLTLSVPLKDRFDSNIFFALIPTEDKNDYLMFKLNDESIENDRITYTGIDAAYDELKGYAYIKEIRPVKRTAKEILDKILEHTRWEVGYIDATATTDAFFYYQSVLECIQQVVQLFNVELTFTYSYNTQTHEITARHVNIYKQLGRRTGKRFEYGSNLLTVTREEDSQDIITALVGRGKGEEKFDDDTGEATGGYGRRISFKDVVWSKANGDPADKPAGQEFVENPEATKIFGYDDGTPRTGIVVFEDIEDPVELLNATWASLVASCRPKVSFKANVTDTGDLRLGDTIAIIRHELGIEYFTRVFKVVRDLKDEHNNTVEMGDDMSGRSLTSYVSDVNNIANQAVQDANQAAVSAGSKNKNFYSTTKPRVASEGDNLFLNLGNGEFEYWVWHNGQWEFIQSTQDLKNVEQNVNSAKDEIEQAKRDIITNKEQANQAITTLTKTVTGLQGQVADGVNKSEFQALSNQLNLKVSKGDVVGQLNIEAGRTLIQNKKIFLDADSVIFGNKAFIPNAAITNISADKINAGTLDAGKINVINMNADNIVAGTLSGKNINMNLTSGRVVFTGGRFYNDKETFDINIDKNYIRSSKQTSYFGTTIDENYTITELKDGSFTISRPNWHLNTDKENWNYSFLGRENIFKITTSEITDKAFSQSSWPITSLYSKNGTVITTDYFVSSADILGIVGSTDKFAGIVIDGTDSNDPSNVMINITSNKSGVSISGGEVINGWLNYKPTINIGVNKDEIGFTCGSANFTGKILCSGLNSTGDLTVTGHFGVFGSKNSIVPTSKGMTGINAYETAEYYFGDLGKAKTDDNGQVLIQLDPLFMETVNTSVPYHVFVSSYSDAYVWVKQMSDDSFVVKSSKPNVEFSWEIKAKRLGYEDTRLEVTQKEIPKELIPEYKEKGIL